jgi:uncharacterized Tic20 family protein
MNWLTYLSLVFGLFLLILGSVIVGSANKLDTENKDVKNARNSGVVVLVVGLVMFLASGAVIGMSMKGSGAGASATAGAMKMKRYYF